VGVNRRAGGGQLNQRPSHSNISVICPLGGVPIGVDRDPTPNKVFLFFARELAGL
jgi:hypothetical protein